MNVINDPEHIIHLPQTIKEAQHTSRKRIGYHVYLSYYFKVFKRVDNETKKTIMIRCNIWDDVDVDDDDGSVDSTMTPRHPLYYEITRAAAKNWNDMQAGGKEAWNKRATILNSRPISDGTFKNVPSDILDSSMTVNILQSLTQDWKNFVRQFKQSILLKSRHGTRVPDSQKVYKFGNEKVVMYSQIYRIIYLNHLLNVTIFGMPLFSKLLSYELRYISKRQKIIHILSHRRMSELFNFGGLDATTHYKNGLKYLCCAKVNLKRRGKNSIGYVLDEGSDDLTIRRETGELIRVKKPEFDKVKGTYLFENCDSGNQSLSFSLTQLWPIRIKINISGQASFILSVATINE